jgi:hypothetical protein
MLSRTGKFRFIAETIRPVCKVPNPKNVCIDVTGKQYSKYHAERIGLRETIQEWSVQVKDRKQEKGKEGML